MHIKISFEIKELLIFEYVFKTCCRVSSTGCTKALELAMFGWDYMAWLKSEETWKELFLALARQNSVWLCITHSSLVLEIRTWHFTQTRVWTEFCLMGKVTVLLSFTSTCCTAETLCTEICSYKIDNSGHCFDMD